MVAMTYWEAYQKLSERCEEVGICLIEAALADREVLCLRLEGCVILNQNCEWLDGKEETGER